MTRGGRALAVLLVIRRRRRRRSTAELINDVQGRSGRATGGVGRFVVGVIGHLHFAMWPGVEDEDRVFQVNHDTSAMQGPKLSRDKHVVMKTIDR